MKIAFLIPCTTNKKNYTDVQQTEILNICYPSLVKTLNKEHEYTIYLGFDDDDKIFSVDENKSFIKNKIEQNENLNITCKIMDFSNIKGHVTRVWNGLFKSAYCDNNDYFVQCGDDIQYTTQNWLNDSIKILYEHDDIGLTGPFCNANRNFTFLTQSVVSRKHMDIFGYYFPEEIKNWWCDDWLCGVYSPEYFYKLLNHRCCHKTQLERYDIVDSKSIYKLLISKGKVTLQNYITDTEPEKK